MSQQAEVEFGEREAVDPKSVVEFLEFRLDGARYALEIGRVEQVIRGPVTTRIPNAPAGIYGASTVQGEVVVVTDTYAVVGLDCPFTDPKDAYLILLERNDTPQPVGLLVESVEGIERHHVDTILPQGDDDTPLHGRWFRAAIVDDEAPDIPVFASQQLVAAIHPLEAR